MMSRRALLAAAFAALPLAAMADDYIESASVGLSKQLLCQTINVASGNLALILGLCLALAGLWTMARFGALKKGFIYIICGALITALPSLLLAGLAGLASTLKNTKLSDYGDLFDVPSIAQKAYSNQCGSIPVDFSGYANMPPWWQAFNNPGGTQNPGQDPTKINQAANSPGIMPLGATTGSAGCTDLVDGGGPGSPFGPRIPPPTSGGRTGSANHPGVDITCQRRDGFPIHASANGTITYASWRGGYGQSIIIDHGGGKVTTYNHMSGYGNDVKVGGTASGNQVIGYCGRTGNVSGPHLHFEVKKNGAFVDPVANGCGH